MSPTRAKKTRLTVSGPYTDTRAEYATRPYAVNVREGDFISVHRFHDLKIARKYAADARKRLKELSRAA